LTQSSSPPAPSVKPHNSQQTKPGATHRLSDIANYPQEVHFLCFDLKTRAHINGDQDVCLLETGDDLTSSALGFDIFNQSSTMLSRIVSDLLNQQRIKNYSGLS